MGKLLLGAAAVVASLSLTAGVAAAQTGNVNVAASGPGAHVGVDSHDENKAKVRNNTNAHVYNDTYQDADSGDAKTWHNTTGGSATSGAASNGNALSVSGSVNQSSGVGGMELGSDNDGDVTVNASGPSSHVHVNSHDKNSVSVKNNVNFKVSNDTTQKAETGDASVVGNTTGGNATSGAASNTNSSSVSLTVTQ
jgi:hypothetical protein